MIDVCFYSFEESLREYPLTLENELKYLEQVLENARKKKMNLYYWKYVIEKTESRINELKGELIK